ncbi:MAG: hypothetical protein JWM53_3348 [bacterium]|nr:hypothetical protein [bacterium]
MSKHALDDFFGTLISNDPFATAPSELPPNFPGQPSPREKLNESARTHQARGAEPRDTPTAYGIRKVLPSDVTGGAPLILDSAGDWRPGRYRDVDGKFVLVIDGEGV